MEILQWVHKMLGGSSPQTGYIGSFGIVMSIMDILSSGAKQVQSELATNGTPTSKMGWVVLLTSIGLRLAKDANKSNAPTPVAEPQTVK